LFLALKEGEVVGRISAFVDDLAIKHWGQNVGLFGSYECIDDAEASQALLYFARDWLRSQGMTSMRGPWSFASQEWGLVVEGFAPAPVILAPYNPAYYNDQLARFGLVKARDLMVYEIDVQKGYSFPERYLKLSGIIQKRFGVSTRPIDMHNLEADVMTITRLANESIADNWGFYPVTEEEARAMARDMKQIVNPAACLIAETSDGKPVGFAMSLPDVNQILKGLNGRLLPFGLFKMLFQLPRLKTYRMWALGVIPEYQGCAIDTLLYCATYEALYSPDLRLEINYVLEDNDRMNNSIRKIGAHDLRRMRVYEMDILSQVSPST
jgi:ribosomal protein S18 acetylase RimI-like enzyme